MASLARIDHLVVACADLAQGDDWVCGRLGTRAQPGGQHVSMGTHNRLLKLGARTYLELIAIDPQGAAQRPRWFGLDTAAVRARAAREPFLLTWVAACNDVDAAAALDAGFGEVIAARRGEFAWRITVPADGRLHFDGAAPALIQWDGALHPCDRLDDRGCRLLGLRLRHPRAATIRPLLDALRIDGPIELQAGEAAISARVQTAGSVVELD